MGGNDNNTKLEGTIQFFYKRKPLINILAFKHEYGEYGMNPIKNFAKVNFNYDIKDIIS